VIASRRSGAVVRAFLALDLPEAAREACASLVRELRARPDGDGVRWVRPGNYHVTLRFLGNVEAERVGELAARVRAATGDVAPFRAALGALHAFPPRRPRVVAVGLEPEAPLRELAARVETGVVEAGLAPERRRFRPHVTLGRVRSRRAPSLEGAACEESDWPVRELVLLRSDLGREGSTYTDLERIPLDAPDAPGETASDPASGRAGTADHSP
jgi:2'-5' RNA ligase